MAEKSIEEKVKDIIVEQLGVNPEQVTLQAKFIEDLGADSLDTVERVRALGEQPYFIIGADAFAEITSWHRWQELVRLTEFIVVTRPGHQYATPAGARVHRLETVAWPRSTNPVQCGPLFPFPQILGLLGRHCHGPSLSCRRSIPHCSGE